MERERERDGSFLKYWYLSYIMSTIISYDLLSIGLDLISVYLEVVNGYELLATTV